MATAADPTIVLALPSGTDSIALSWGIADANDIDAVLVEKRAYTGAWGSGSWGSYAAVSASPLAASAVSHSEGSLSTHTAYQFRVRARKGLHETTTVQCVADVSDSLDGTYFRIYDADGSVAVWIDVDNSGTAEPSHGCDRAIEITTIVTDDTADTVAAKIQAVLDADSEFSATVSTDTITVVDANPGTRTDASDLGSTGFTITKTQDGDDDGESSAWVASNQTFTFPSAVGVFKGRSALAVAAWDLVLIATGSTGFLVANKVGTDWTNARADFDPTTVIWGPEIDLTDEEV